MERIEQVLHRIQGIYYDERAKTNIDIDLMLDYTRVLYADLLEWKKNVPKIEIITKQEEDQSKDESTDEEKIDEPVISNEEKNENENEESTQTELAQENQENENSIEMEDGKNDTSNTSTETIEDEKEQDEDEENKKTEEIKDKIEITEVEESAQTELTNETLQKQTIEEEVTESPNEEQIEEAVPELEDEIIYEPTEPPANIEKAPDDFFYRERPVLSFELPKSQEEINEEQASLSIDTEQDSSEENETAINEVKSENKSSQSTDKEVPKPPALESFEIPHSNYENLFSAVQPKVAVDIRKNIGLNDRYLFLNEMFKNKKAEYEACLNQINKCKNLDEAQNYLVSIAAHNNWNKEDETVESFYSMLSKHFSNR